MLGPERREKLLALLESSREPISGSMLGKHFGVSRQIIVQDIALLRGAGSDIFSTNKGYILAQREEKQPTRLFKLHHRVEDTEEELSCIINLGGCVEDVFINHRMYGQISAKMNIRNHADIDHYLNDIATGVSAPLLSATSGYHFHHISAPSEDILDEIEAALTEKGFVSQFLPYEEHFG